MKFRRVFFLAFFLIYRCLLKIFLNTNIGLIFDAFHSFHTVIKKKK